MKVLSSTGFSLCSFDFRLPQIKTTQAEVFSLMTSFTVCYQDILYTRSGN
jgi:hypothetical protein